MDVSGSGSRELQRVLFGILSPRAKISRPVRMRGLDASVRLFGVNQARRQPSLKTAVCCAACFRLQSVDPHNEACQKPLTRFYECTSRVMVQLVAFSFLTDYFLLMAVVMLCIMCCCSRGPRSETVRVHLRISKPGYISAPLAL